MTTHPETTGTTATSPLPDMPPTVIPCAACLDISGAQDLYGRLRTAGAAQRPVVLDASQVERADTAVLQLLYAWCEDARAHGIPVQWQQPSPALRQAAQLLDLTAGLDLPPM